MYGCESWTIKKAKHWRIDAFELWCWRRLPRVHWTARSNQSILMKISPEYSLERLMRKVHYFGHLLQRADSLENTLTLGRIESRKRKGRQRMRFLDGITESVHMSLSKLRKTVKDREAWRAVVHGVAKSLLWLIDWRTGSAHSKNRVWNKRELWAQGFIITSWFYFFHSSQKAALKQAALILKSDIEKSLPWTCSYEKWYKKVRVTSEEVPSPLIIIYKEQAAFGR